MKMTREQKKCPICYAFVKQLRT